MAFSISALIKKKAKKSIKDYKQELLNKQGAEQLKKMVERGIDLPVVPL